MTLSDFERKQNCQRHEGSRGRFTIVETVTTLRIPVFLYENKTSNRPTYYYWINVYSSDVGNSFSELKIYIS